MGYKAQRILCKATRRDGQPCTRYASIGQLVCNHHGGAAPQAKNKAKERIENVQVDAIERMQTLIPKAIWRAERILEDDDARASDHLKAVELILDRFIAKKVHTEVTDDRESRNLDAEIEKFLPPAQEAG